MIQPEQIWSSPNLPTLPTIAVRLLDLSKKGADDVNEVVDVIKSDPAISAKILKSTNSSHFGFCTEVLSIDRAVPLLGTNVITSMALGFSLIDDSMQSGPVADEYKDFWLRSIAQAATAELLVASIDGLRVPESFQTALLVDIGRLAMLAAIPDEYIPVIEKSRELQQDLARVETAELGFDHVWIGEKLAKKWRLPATLQTAIRLHHAPLSQLLKHEADAEFQLYSVVAVAAAVADYFCAANKGQALETIRSLTTALFAFDEQRINEFLESAKPTIEDSAAMFAVNIAELGSPRVLLAEANEQLAEIAIQAQLQNALAAERQQTFELERENLKRQNQNLQHQALHDPLTNAYNRLFFDEAVEKETERCIRVGEPFAILFGDIDHFKNLNDTYGHQFGDLVLQCVSKAIQKSIRTSDVLARYGGEEFVVLVQTPTIDGLTVLAERVRRNVESAEVRHDGESVQVTMSIGAALMDVTRIQDTENVAQRLIAAADEAMYQAKSNGRNQIQLVSIPSPTIGDVMKQRMQRLDAIRDPAVASFLKTVDSVLSDPVR